MSIEQTEAECAANAVAPRVSLTDIENNIAARYDFTAGEAVTALNIPAVPSLELLTISLVVMRNGFVVIGKSAPASPENFNAELGMKLAYEDAIRQIWPLMGYALRDKLAEAEGFQPETLDELVPDDQPDLAEIAEEAASDNARVEDVAEVQAETASEPEAQPA